MTEDRNRIGELLGAGAAAAPSLDPAHVLTAARLRRSRRRATLAAGVAGAAAVAVVLAVTAGGLGRDDAAPVAPAPSRTAQVSPPPTHSPSPSEPPAYSGSRFVLVNGVECGAGTILCFQVLDQASGAAPSLSCSIGPRAMASGPFAPDRALADGTRVQLLPARERLHGFVGDRYFVLDGVRDLTEADYLAAGLVCAQAPTVEQLRVSTTVWAPDGEYPDTARAGDAELLGRLVAFAADPAVEPSSVPFGPTVFAGYAVAVEPVRDVADRGSWPVPQVDGDRTSSLELLAQLTPTDDPTTWSSADGRTWRMTDRPAPACGAQDLPVVPTPLVGSRAVSLASVGDASCLDAGSVTVYRNEQGQVVGVVGGVWEP